MLPLVFLVFTCACYQILPPCLAFTCCCRWNTPLDEEDVAPEEHRATWGEGEAPPLPPPAASRKRPLEDDDELDEDVKRRLASLQGGSVD